MSRTLFTSRAWGDLKDLTLRKSLREELSLDALVFMEQSHSDIVRVVDATSATQECDALVTTSKGVGLAAMAADCMPIVFTSPSVVGVAHVGRVGLVKEIAIKVVNQMRQLGSAEISATIGPSICWKCYEVSPEMYEEITTLIPATATSPESHVLNLQAGVRSQLESVGVSVFDLGICTLENPLYFSFRGGDQSARAAGIISL
jgi:YfiH family protein